MCERAKPETNQVAELTKLVGAQVISLSEVWEQLSLLVLRNAELRNELADLALRVERLEAVRPAALAPH